LLACLAAAAACSDDNTTGPLVPRNIAVVAGDTQQGTANFPVATPIRVKVTSGDGQAVAGVAVAFATDAPGASVTEDTVLTNEQGEASTSWTLGSTAGDQHARRPPSRTWAR
jgi:hypothetical protein